MTATDTKTDLEVDHVTEPAPEALSGSRGVRRVGAIFALILTLAAVTIGAASTPAEADHGPCHERGATHTRTPLSTGGRTYYFGANTTKVSGNCSDTNAISSYHTGYMKGRYFNSNGWQWGTRTVEVPAGVFGAKIIISNLSSGTTFKHGHTVNGTGTVMLF